ncbi:MAG: hypothetical protein HYX32_06530 [Actinobacteria bacterium]|nr:hypothetical protein [Actinomycetota bacterium]
MSVTVRGVYPGSFNPPTVAHLAIAEAAVARCGLASLTLVISLDPLGKDGDDLLPRDRRLAVLERAATTRPWLRFGTTEHRLIADIAAGYDVIVVGADKWGALPIAACRDRTPHRVRGPTPRRSPRARPHDPRSARGPSPRLGDRRSRRSNRLAAARSERHRRRVPLTSR